MTIIINMVIIRFVIHSVANEMGPIIINATISPIIC